MLKPLLGGIWLCAIALGSTYAAAVWKVGHTPPPGGSSAATASAEPLQAQKTRPISVPMIADGVVQGYIVAQFTFTLIPGTAKSPVPPDAFVVDEAFRQIYGDSTLDFRHLERYDLAHVTKDLVPRVNARLGGDVVKDILVQDFNFLTKDDVRK